MKPLFKHLDNNTIFVMILTFILFVMALFVKGLTQDLLLEAAIFLVSVKLIYSTYKLSVWSQEIKDEIREIHNILKK